MTMDIKEAVATLRNYRDRIKAGLVVMGSSADTDEMCQTVGKCYPVIVDAYFAEHPDDDEQPITEAWLKQLGFKMRIIIGYPGSVLSLSPFEWKEWAEGGWTLSLIGGWPPWHTRTKGPFRQLARALNIDLKEPE